MRERSEPRLLLLLFVGVLMAALDIAIVGPALPAIQLTSGVDARAAAWVFTIFVLFNLVATPTMAKLSDRGGRRPSSVAAVRPNSSSPRRQMVKQQASRSWHGQPPQALRSRGASWVRLQRFTPPPSRRPGSAARRSRLLAGAHGLLLVVDSTVATPALLRPLLHGADVVAPSVTKTMTTSGSCIAGAVIARKGLVSRIRGDELGPDFAAYLKWLPNRDIGPNLSPMNAVLSLNCLRTLRGKVDQFSRSTMQVARFLAAHPAVEGVDSLGLEGHPLHALAARQAFDALQRIWRATDLGRVKSVATIPAISTRSQQGEEGRELAGVPGNLIRLAVGGEHPDDVIADLDQALAAVRGEPRSAAVPVGFSVGEPCPPACRRLGRAASPSHHSQGFGRRSSTSSLLRSGVRASATSAGR